LFPQCIYFWYPRVLCHSFLAVVYMDNKIKGNECIHVTIYIYCLNICSGHVTYIKHQPINILPELNCLTYIIVLLLLAADSRAIINDIDVILLGFMIQIIYTMVFRVKQLTKLTLRVHSHASCSLSRFAFDCLTV
jgi:hypothetical protein